MRLAIVTDAWYPQVNGVVTTLAAVVDWLREQDHVVEVIEPSGFSTVPCPGYPEIRLAFWPPGGVRRRLRQFAPERVHVVTEGPLGWAAVRFLNAVGWRRTSSFHTRFPEYLQARLPFIPLAWGYAALRRFHGASSVVLVPTRGMAADLAAWGFDNLVVWHRGVDTRVFRPEATFEPALERPIFLFAGRVAPEKNVATFLELDLPGTKVVVGDGPDRPALQRAHPEVQFVGYRYGEDLAAWYAAADVFVFPSRTDTFGVVMLESMACGTPVAAFPVTGPVDVVIDGTTGRLDADLACAARDCLSLDRASCRDWARRQDWRAAARFFLDHTVTVETDCDVDEPPSGPDPQHSAP